MSQQAIANQGKRVIVLGGGLAGLSFAHYLRNFLAFYKKTDLVRKITIFEANDYMGGSIKSNVFDDNVVHELGPRSVRIQSVKAQNTCVLFEQLGLSDRLLTTDPKSMAGKDRFVYRNGKMWRVPSTILQLFNKLPASEQRLWSVVRTDFSNKKRMDLSAYPFGDPPLYDFVKYRVGEEAAEAVLDPLLRGITAGDCRTWSTKGIFADMLEREQTYGGLLRGLSKPPVSRLEHDELYTNDCLKCELLHKFQKDKVVSANLSTGLQTLPEHLSNSLLNSNDDDVVAVYNRTKALNVKFRDELKTDEAPCSVVVETVDGDQINLDADHIVAALPAKDFSAILDHENSTMPEDQRKSLKFVSEINHAPVGCVTVEYRNLDKKLPDIVNSFGFLTHSKANSRLLGIAFDTAAFPSIDKDTGGFRMTCMMGGAWAEQVFKTTDMNSVTEAYLEQIALEEIRAILKINEDPYRMSSILWKTGIAQYRPGHVDLIKQTRDQINSAKLPLTLVGQSYDGVAVNDIIFAARIEANKLANLL